MKFILAVIKAVLNLIYFFIKLFPLRNKVTIVSRQSNEPSMDISMLRDEIKRQSGDTEVVCLCRTIGNGFAEKIKYCFHLLRQMWHLGTSKAIVTDSYCIGISILRQRKNVKVIQMWHALGAFKKFGLSIAGNDGEGRDAGIAEAMNMHRNYTCVIASSEKCREPYMEAFGYDSDTVKIMSLPRVDAILDSNLKNRTVQKIHGVYPELKNKKTVVYAPTFRKDIDISGNVNALAKAFDSSKYSLVLKKHPLMDTGSCEAGIIVDEQFSTLEMMWAADYIICDYSAVVFEAALMEKPLFFYAFDLDSYEDKRNFYLDYENDMPGIVSASPEAIAEAVEKENYDLDAVKRFADTYIENRADCTKSLAAFIIS